MDAFVSGIIEFCGSVYLAIQNYFASYNLGLYDQFNTFMQTKIIDGTMISSPLTWYQLIRFVIPIVLIIFFIIFICKFIFKLIGLVKIW